MPILKFTDADKLASKVITEKGVFTGILSELEGPKKSASGSSHTFFATFKITQPGPWMSKEINVAFNTGTREASILGGSMWHPYRDLMKVAAAVQKVKFDDVDQNIDTDLLIGQPMDLVIAPESADGNLINVIKAWLPEGTGSAASPF